MAQLLESGKSVLGSYFCLIPGCSRNNHELVSSLSSETELGVCIDALKLSNQPVWPFKLQV